MVSNRSLVAILHAVTLLFVPLIVYLVLSAVPDNSSFPRYFVVVPTIEDHRDTKTDPKCTAVRIFTTYAENFTQYIEKRRKNMTLENATDPYLIPRRTKVNPYKYSFLIDGRSICQAEAPLLLIVVPSVFDHQKERKIIRETWGSVVKTGRWADDTNVPCIKLLFLFGMRYNSCVYYMLKNESLEYGDIVLVDFVDSYRNLTIKSISALYWAIQFCPDAEYLLKNDEDTIINLPRLIDVLKHSSTKVVLGRQRKDPTVIRTKHQKWSVRKAEYPLDWYPPYIFGNYYVIPNNLIAKLFHLSEYIPYLSMEDVFITGIVRQAAGASLRSLARRTCSHVRCVNVTKMAYIVGADNITQYWEGFRSRANLSSNSKSRWT